MEIEEPAVDYKPKMTIEQYLEFENASSEKHEYYKGEVFAMSGAKVTHNRITKNTLNSLINHLDEKFCEPFGSDLRIYVEKSELFAYPDISIFCENLITRNNDDMNSLNPSIIIEVLSPSTKNYNRGLKFTLYKRIETLKEYILIDSEIISIDTFAINQEGDWQLTQYKNMAIDFLYKPFKWNCPCKPFIKELFFNSPQP